MKWKKSPNFAELRKRMVDEQLRLRDIHDERVLNAFLKVPRDRFVLKADLKEAYDDHPLPIGEAQTISQPYMVALMTQLLELKGNERVLEVGTGSGYQAAILAELSKEVFTVERIAVLSERAQKVLQDLGYTNVRFKVADGTLGWLEEAPFDRIMITAGAPRIPPCILQQLNEGGILTAPIGGEYAQELVVARKVKGKVEEQGVCTCVFVKLVGEQGW